MAKMVNFTLCIFYHNFKNTFFFFFFFLQKVQPETVSKQLAEMQVGETTAEVPWGLHQRAGEGGTGTPSMSPQEGSSH